MSASPPKDHQLIERVVLLMGAKLLQSIKVSDPSLSLSLSLCLSVSLCLSLSLSLSLSLALPPRSQLIS